MLSLSVPPVFIDKTLGPLIPLLAVITPTESIFVTSSYVNVPPTPMFPVTDKSPVIF